MDKIETLLQGIKQGDFISIARALTIVENSLADSEALLRAVEVQRNTPIIGITGPPGAGKSTLVNAITADYADAGKRVAILAVDPTSPFNFGSLLGDRIRMAQQFNKPNVYIRSVATRGALGGISTKTMEMVDVLSASNFDIIIIETVGVGQSELEIAGLAERTVVVLVPESGDEIQNIKSGLMEIAQAFVVNKSDREGADLFANNLKKMLRHSEPEVPVFRTVADKNEGIEPLCAWLSVPLQQDNFRKPYLLAEKAFKLLQFYRTQDVDKQRLMADIKVALEEYTGLLMHGDNVSNSVLNNGLTV
jgi:LAO/AO transport system kinase